MSIFFFHSLALSLQNLHFLNQIKLIRFFSCPYNIIRLKLQFLDRWISLTIWILNMAMIESCVPNWMPMMRNSLTNGTYWWIDRSMPNTIINSNWSVFCLCCIVFYCIVLFVCVCVCVYGFLWVFPLSSILFFCVPFVFFLISFCFISNLTIPMFDWEWNEKQNWR